MDRAGRPPSVFVSDEQSDVPLDPDDLLEVAEGALRVLDVPPEAALTVTLVDEPRIADLKEQAFGVRRATDVLSFPMDDLDDPMPGPLVLGDVVICPKVAARQAAGLGIALEDELRHLLVHGILHVLGRDHADAATELAMAREEREVLGAVHAARAGGTVKGART